MNRTMFLCAFLGIVLAGCAPSQHGSKPHNAKPTKSTAATAPKLSPKIWHIAGFTVRELPLPADYKQNENRELIVGTTLLKMASKQPYIVTWQSLTSNQTGTVINSGCPENTLFAYPDQNGSYPPGDAAIICVSTKASTLTIIHVPDMRVSTFTLPGRPDWALEYALNTFAFGWPTDPRIMWSVQQSEGPAPLLGSGILDLKTGTEAPQPRAFNTELYVAPDGTLYAQNGSTLSRWDETAFEPLGTVPNVRVYAVDNSGAVWADQPSPSNIFQVAIIRETPGSTKTKSWNVVGTNLLIGPGFAAYTPGESIYGAVKILFPEVDRTLAINNVFGEPLLAGFERTNDQILFTTSAPPVVIEIIPRS